MNFGMACMAGLVLIIPAVVTAQSDETPSPPVLVIRTYNMYRVSGEHLRVAQDAAAAILKDVRIDIRWLDCGQVNPEPIGESARCGQAPASNELLLRIQSAGSVGGARIKSMGFSMVGRRPEDYTPFFATVCADVVAVVARGAGVDARRLLGVAFAHEIGHLLLNSPRHSSSGLMRAFWSRSELQEGRKADWLFQIEEAETLRQAIAERTRCQTPARPGPFPVKDHRRDCSPLSSTQARDQPTALGHERED
jgi:hypothetical protein